MNILYAALWTEGLKIRKAKIFMLSLLAFALIALMLALLVLIARYPEIAGRSSTLEAKASLLGKADWPSFLSLLIQIILSLGTLGFGIITSWVFGREISDRTLKDLLALPTPRATIVLAKLLACAFWGSLLALTLWGVALLAGLAFQIPGWSTARPLETGQIYAKASLLTLLLCTPVAWFASFGRGYLLAISYVILTLVMTQLIAVGAPGLMPYFPWAFPALVSGVAGSAIPPANLWSVLIFVGTVLGGGLGTAGWWQWTDQN
ncbi:bacitracin ABC transporter permease [bacterium (Candidatus Blackallbacteria) CG17_big_fil_post_rev_8_21_14_2_50_48_46]|uniref:Bacitracin ABC transporter permease n=1 Tax=bacterium (Candidatus Blackallbacteria) CG17_big_fil_post_rev_8_21_14_2_50_48_46 TaxID=2014261 RepID=A0A2M7G2F2_9BACT|nr:MAG: bacitracin ABC transporter permease [bacterium (Candidatus Blackallbacteria) CG18_big_fil_WC_8_21_14_2_50_49_26]PIW15795.1 MAG: bacitracin ABC transporter permease [bacterium (Candidatus Blackallbacteria) CG17_big_fil_post_rev_8_21_14_2_50_48_46]PIW47780.1 MAG: bacitracin ABC transporter permease [bacterium (Candidatus Blackallbacteria) CG13_big_fil_rev_8_21_14_2_50_49_14]